jgi:hypothetical protein
MVVVPYTEETKDAIVAEQVALGRALIGYQDVEEGTFLEFSTPDEIAEMDLEREIFLKLGKALFLHENRIRALEGKAPITKVQFLAALKAL